MQNILDTILPFFSIILAFVMGFLPNSPFRAYIDMAVNIPYLGILNWLFPISEAIVVLETFLAAYVVVLTYKVLMRYINLL